MNPLEAVQADPVWSACFDRLATALDGKAAPLEDPGLPLYGPETALENYARAVSAASSPGISLALTLPMALTVGTVAGQGAYWARLPQPGGHNLDIPMIMQSTLIAPSGYGKSTSLTPLTKIINRLDRAGHYRRAEIMGKKHTAALDILEQVPLAEDLMADEKAKLTAIYKGGACTAGLMLDSSTPEGIRQHLLMSGSVAGILTAEPDVLQEISKYSKDGQGTFRWFLDGWSGARVGVARAKDGSMVIPRACLPYCIVIQPIAFEQFTASKDRNNAGVTADSAIGRGLYGRSWLVRIEGFAGVTEAFGLPSKEQVGLVGGVTGALIAVEASLEKIMIRSDEYRVQMGLAMGWEKAVGTGDTGQEAKPEPEPDEVWLGLSADAWLPYGMVQNMRLAMIELVEQLEAKRPGSKRLLTPMVTRWTEHVIRVAMELALVVDAGTVDIPRWAVEDAALRICPWLLEHWSAEMHRYQQAATVALLEQETKNNTRGLDLTYEGRVIAAMKELGEEQVATGVEPDDVAYRQSDVVNAAKRKVSSLARAELVGPLNEAFKGLVDKKWLSEHQSTKGKGRPSVRFKPTTLGKMHGI